MCFIDKTILDLCSLLIAGVGIFAVLTKYSVPELGMTFLGTNPFATKHDHIESTMTRYFTGLALTGFAIQGVSIILTGVIKDRLYSASAYAVIFVIGTVLCWPLAKIVAYLARPVARRAWVPEVVQGQLELYDQAVDILKNDGMRSDQLRNGNNFNQEDLARYRKANFDTVEKHLQQIEKLLELEPIKEGQKERLNHIGTIFSSFPHRQSGKA